MVVWEDEQFLKYWIIFLPRSDAQFELKSTEVVMWLTTNSWVEINTELPPNEAVSVVNYHLRFIISLKYLVVQLILWWSSLRDQKRFWKLSSVNAALCCFHQWKWKLCLSSFKLWASSRSVVISVRSQQTAADWRFHRENTFLLLFSRCRFRWRSRCWRKRPSWRAERLLLPRLLAAAQTYKSHI